MRGVKPRLVVSNPDTVSPVPAPPSHLPSAAKAEWKRVVPDLIARGIFTDPPLVENYCAAVAGAREAQKALKGRVMLGEKAHPAVRMHQQYLEIARRHAAELGLTPIARQRTAPIAKPDEADDEWA
ncbi:MAG: phage terminase small subunit P27 family [Pseudomonadota bacterium]